MMKNPLIYTSGIAPFDKIEPGHVVPAVTQVLDQVSADFAALEQKLSSMSQVTWDDVVEPLDDMEEAIHRVWGPVSHLFSVKNSPELRVAYEAVQPKLVELGLKLSQSKTCYDAYEKLKSDPKQWTSLSKARQRILEQRLLSARLAGVALTGAAKVRFNDLAQEMAQLRTKFSNNALDATKAWSLVLTTQDEVEGLPDHILQLAAQDWSRTHENKSASAKTGPWRFTLDAPSYIPFMEFSKRRDLRERMYRARIVLASQGQWDNSPLIDRILEIRKETAALVGFKNYADMSVASKMSGSVQAVDQLLEKLLAASLDAGKSEHKALEDFAKTKGFHGDLLEWDIPFWAQRLKEERYEYSEDDLRPYFPISKVLSGMFRLVQKLFGVRVESADGETAVWHPDVRFFKIYEDSSNKHIASFFLDPFSRPENKRGGAWMDDCVHRRKHKNGLNLPVAYLVCNGTPPVGSQPGLMSFDEVRTLFHEFGHGLQHMLTTVDDMGVAGIAGVEWDAVELPSQFMENWLYHVPTLKAISGHVDTGEALPQVYIEKIQAAKNYRAATGMLRQLQFAMIDMELHARFDPQVESPHQLATRIAKRTSPLPPRPESRTLCTFSHIFAGGYSAGYYSYKWAEVLSADAFAAFEEAGLDRDDAVALVGRRYRDTVLAMGGSEHPTEVFKAFRGREPSAEALLRHSGLS